MGDSARTIRIHQKKTFIERAESLIKQGLHLADIKRPQLWQIELWIWAQKHNKKRKITKFTRKLTKEPKSQNHTNYLNHWNYIKHYNDRLNQYNLIIQAIFFPNDFVFLVFSWIKPFLFSSKVNSVLLLHSEWHLGQSSNVHLRWRARNGDSLENDTDFFNLSWRSPSCDLLVNILDSCQWPPTKYSRFFSIQAGHRYQVIY